MPEFPYLQWAAVEVDADAAENADVKPELEPGEFIDVFLVPFQGLHKTLMVRQCQQCAALIHVQLMYINCKVDLHFLPKRGLHGCGCYCSKTSATAQKFESVCSLLCF